MLSSSSDDSHSFEDSDVNDLEDLDEMSTIEVMSHCQPSQQQKVNSICRKDDMEIAQSLTTNEYPKVTFV